MPASNGPDNGFAGTSKAFRNLDSLSNLAQAILATCLISMRRLKPLSWMISSWADNSFGVSSTEPGNRMYCPSACCTGLWPRLLNNWFFASAASRAACCISSCPSALHFATMLLTSAFKRPPCLSATPCCRGLSVGTACTSAFKRFSNVWKASPTSSSPRSSCALTDAPAQVTQCAANFCSILLLLRYLIKPVT